MKYTRNFFTQLSESAEFQKYLATYQDAWEMQDQKKQAKKLPGLTDSDIDAPITAISMDDLGGRSAVNKLRVSKAPEAELDAMIAAADRRGETDKSDRMRDFRDEFLLQRGEMSNGSRRQYQRRVEVRSASRDAKETMQPLQSAEAQAPATSSAPAVGGSGSADGKNYADIAQSARDYIKAAGQGDPTSGRLQALLQQHNKVGENKTLDQAQRDAQRASIDQQIQTVLNQAKGAAPQADTPAATGSQGTASSPTRTSGSRVVKRLSRPTPGATADSAKVANKKAKKVSDSAMAASLKMAQKRISNIRKAMKDLLKQIRKEKNKDIKARLRDRLGGLDRDLGLAYVTLERVKDVAVSTGKMERTTREELDQAFREIAAASAEASAETGKKSEVLIASDYIKEKTGDSELEQMFKSQNEMTRERLGGTKGSEKPSQEYKERESDLDQAWAKAEAELMDADADMDDAELDAEPPADEVEPEPAKEKEAPKKVTYTNKALRPGLTVKGPAEVKKVKEQIGSLYNKLVGDGVEPESARVMAELGVASQQHGRSKAIDLDFTKVPPVSQENVDRVVQRVENLKSFLDIKDASTFELVGAVSVVSDELLSKHTKTLYDQGFMASVVLNVPAILTGRTSISMLKKIDQGEDLGSVPSYATVKPRALATVKEQLEEPYGVDILCAALDVESTVCDSFAAQSVLEAASVLDALCEDQAYLVEGADSNPILHQTADQLAKEINFFLTDEGWEELNLIGEDIASLSAEEALRFKFAQIDFHESNTYWLPSEKFHLCFTAAYHGADLKEFKNPMSHKADNHEDLWTDPRFQEAMWDLCEGITGN